MKVGSGPGMDGTPAVLLKISLGAFLLDLVSVFNRMISSGIGGLTYGVTTFKGKNGAKGLLCHLLEGEIPRLLKIVGSPRLLQRLRIY
jgi:hypothetical protein